MSVCILSLWFNYSNQIRFSIEFKRTIEKKILKDWIDFEEINANN